MKEEEFLQRVSEKLFEQYKKAISLFENNKLEGSREKLEQIMGKNKDFIPAYNKIGVIEIYEENFEEAEKWFTKALSINDEYLPSLLNLANIYQKNGQIDEALALYQKIIRIDSDYGLAYNNLAALYKKQGNYIKSVKYMKKARKKNSLSYKYDPDIPMYKDPGVIGCLGMGLFIIIVILLIIVFVL